MNFHIRKKTYGRRCTLPRVSLSSPRGSSSACSPCRSWSHSQTEGPLARHACRSLKCQGLICSHLFWYSFRWKIYLLRANLWFSTCHCIIHTCSSSVLTWLIFYLFWCLCILCTCPVSQRVENLTFYRFWYPCILVEWNFYSLYLYPLYPSWYPLHLFWYLSHLFRYPSGLWKNSCIFVWFTVLGILDLDLHRSRCFLKIHKIWQDRSSFLHFVLYWLTNIKP